MDLNLALYASWFHSIFSNQLSTLSQTKKKFKNGLENVCMKRKLNPTCHETFRSILPLPWNMENIPNNKSCLIDRFSSIFHTNYFPLSPKSGHIFLTGPKKKKNASIRIRPDLKKKIPNCIAINAASEFPNTSKSETSSLSIRNHDVTPVHSNQKDWWRWIDI